MNSETADTCDGQGEYWVTEKGLYHTYDSETQAANSSSNIEIEVVTLKELDATMNSSFHSVSNVVGTFHSVSNFDEIQIQTSEIARSFIENVVTQDETNSNRDNLSIQSDVYKISVERRSSLDTVEVLKNSDFPDEHTGRHERDESTIDVSGKLLKNDIARNAFQLFEEAFKKACTISPKKRINKKPYDCGTCGKGFKGKGELSRHILSHTKTKEFVCDQCDKRYMNKSYLKMHKSKFCKMGLKSNTSLTDISSATNMSSSTLKKPYFTQNTEDENQATQASPVNINDFTCGTCDKTFKYNYDLKRHMLSHFVKRKKFKCTFCDKTFTTSAYIKQHKLSFCRMRRKQAENLTSKFGNLTSSECMHKDEPIHSVDTKVTLCDVDVDPSNELYMCREEDEFIEDCDIRVETIKSVPSPRRHISVHKGTTSFSCQSCDKRFVRKCDLSRHMIRSRSCRVRGTAVKSLHKDELIADDQEKLDGEMKTNQDDLVAGDLEKIDDQMKTDQVEVIAGDQDKMDDQMKTDQVELIAGDQEKLDDKAKTYQKELDVGDEENVENKNKRYVAPPNASVGSHKVSPIFRKAARLKMHVCNLCGKEFRKKSNLVGHFVAHSKRNFSCDFCDKGFIGKAKLSHHKLLVHRDELVADDQEKMDVQMKTNQDELIAGDQKKMDDQMKKCEVELITGDEEKMNNKMKTRQDRLYVASPAANVDFQKVLHVFGKANRLKKFVCNLCDKEFQKKSHLDSHSVSHRKRNFNCGLCDKRFIGRRRLSQHRSLAHPVESSEDDEEIMDDKVKTLQDKLNVASPAANLSHVSGKAGLKKYMCNLCDKEFQKKSHMECHLVAHSKRNFNCDICDKRFIGKKKLAQHQLLVHQDESIADDQEMMGDKTKTNQVESSFFETNGLKVHRCKVCCKEFKRINHLNRHLVLHSNNDFNCDVCHKRFVSKRKMSQHRLMHHHKASSIKTRSQRTTDGGKTGKSDEGSKPASTCLVVDGVSEKINTDGDTRKAADAMENTSGETELACLLCGKVFYSTHNVSRHMLLHRKKCFSCDLCDKTFINNCSMSKHRLLHMVGGEKNNALKPPQKINNGKGNVKVKRFKSSYEKKKRDLVKGVQGERMSGCYSCKKKYKYKTKSGLLRHLSSHKDKSNDFKKPIDFIKDLQAEINPSCLSCRNKYKYKTEMGLHRHLAKHKDNSKDGKLDDEHKTAVTISDTADESKKTKDVVKKAPEVAKFTCILCFMEFKTRLCLNRHMGSHRNKSFNCDLCEKRFVSTSTMTQHRSLHLKNVAAIRNLLNPMKSSQTEEKTVMNETFVSQNGSSSVTETSGTNFPAKRRLRLRTKTSELPISVSENELSSLDETPEAKTYNCSKCSRVFYRKYRLRRHLLSHKGIKFFSCDLCQQKFASRSGVTVHKQKCHGIEKKFDCDKCDKSYHREKHLRRHSTTHNSMVTRYPCDQCHKTFTRKEHVKRHQLESCNV